MINLKRLLLFLRRKLIVVSLSVFSWLGDYITCHLLGAIILIVRGLIVLNIQTLIKVVIVIVTWVQWLPSLFNIVLLGLMVLDIIHIVELFIITSLPFLHDTSWWRRNLIIYLVIPIHISIPSWILVIVIRSSLSFISLTILNKRILIRNILINSVALRRIILLVMLIIWLR